MYSEVLPSIRGMASALTKMGFKKGDMMIMFTSNHVLYFITILSAWKCGGGVTLSNQFAPAGRNKISLFLLVLLS